jgi:hypothetical protein
MTAASPATDLTPPADARMIWCDDHGRGRNKFVYFRKTFRVDRPIDAATLYLYAHTRYRAFLDGRPIAHGPARGFPERPVLDAVPVGSLEPGEHVLAVLVGSAGCTTFHSHDTAGGLIGWLTDDANAQDPLLVTDTDWLALPSPAHTAMAPNLTFALNAAEICDLRHEPVGWETLDFPADDWSPAVVRAEPDIGPLRPRPIPLLDESATPPARRIGTWSVHPSGWVAHRLAVEHDVDRGTRAPRRFFIKAFLHVPEDQTVDLRLDPPTDAWIDGTRHPALGRSTGGSVPLTKGWHELQFRHEAERVFMSFGLLVREGQPATVRGDRDLDSNVLFYYSDVLGGAEADRVEDLAMPLPDGALPDWAGAWRVWPVDTPYRPPAEEHRLRSLQPMNRFVEPAEGAVGRAELYDYGHELLGRPRIELDAPAGVCVDLAYTEQQYDDGRALVHGRGNVLMVERFFTRQGRQTFHLFHPRGMRYLELQLTGPGHEQAEIVKVDATAALYPVENVGRFACSDPKLSRIWDLGQEALRPCMEDAYLDCPWRERGVYVGDLLVEYRANLAALGDHALMRRSIEIFLEGQGDNGLIRGGAYVLEPGRYPDYTLLLPLCATDYIDATGDHAFIAEYGDAWKRLASGILDWRLPDGDLIDGSEHGPYVDLAVHRHTEPVSLALNAMFVAALRGLARLCDDAGVQADTDAWRAQADRTAEAIRATFWDDQHHRFSDLRPQADADRTPSIHGNTLAALYDIADDRQAQGALRYLLDVMPDNLLGNSHPADREHCRVNAYFAHYLIDLLAREGRHDEAVAFIRDNYGRMVDGGAVTSWEYFAPGPGASRCHAWAAAPTWYLTERVLGVRIGRAEDGHPVTLEPNACGLDWARGVVPHPAGPIHVRWELDAQGEMLVHIDAPDGVDVRVSDAAMSSAVPSATS